MDYQLVAIDMDGTLLNSHSKISAKNLQALKDTLKKGIKVVLCSARPFNGLIDYAKQIGLSGKDQYLIYLGGNIIQNYAGEVIYSKKLRNEDCEKVSDFLSERKIKFSLIDNEGTLYDGYQDWIEKYMLDTKLGIVKVLLKTRKHKLAELKKLAHATYDDKFYVVQTSDTEMQLMAKDVNKGTALEHLVKHLGLNLSQVMAIGDMYNDLPMLKIAGLSVAMGNATSEVKAVASQTVPDNDHDGVAIALEQNIIPATDSI